MLDYPLMDPPFEIKPFKQMNKKEAKNHFDWYVEQIPSRIALLKEAVKQTSFGTDIVFDFTAESLKPLWIWFKGKITVKPKTVEEMDREKANIPERFRDVIEIKQYTLDLGTLTLAMDISIYFAEVLRRNNSELKWDVLFRPLSFVDVNQPLLINSTAKVTLNTRSVLRNLTEKMLTDEASDDLLIDMYHLWASNFVVFNS